jgi:preprotein translocase subunit SecA
MGGALPAAAVAKNTPSSSSSSLFFRKKNSGRGRGGADRRRDGAVFFSAPCLTRFSSSSSSSSSRRTTTTTSALFRAGKRRERGGRGNASVVVAAVGAIGNDDDSSAAENKSGEEVVDDDDLEYEFKNDHRAQRLVLSSSSSDFDDENEKSEKINIPTVRPREEDAKTADVEVLRSMPLIEKLYETVVNPVNKLEPEMRKLTSAELKAKTLEFRSRLTLGETLEDVMVEAFAVVREASRRELGLRHFDVQLVGGALLHMGVVAEMATGEGKTLVATLPAYLNALSRRGVHIVTVNDYLAERDAVTTAKIHGALGLTVGYVLSEDSPEERRRSYDCDITYVTNQEIGFDYLRDNMATSVDELVVMTRPLNFAIVDEVDSVLIDEGRNPLLITGPSDMDEGPRYVAAAKIAESLVEGRDYKADRKEKTIEMTDEGMTNAEILLDVEDLWDPIDPWGKYVILAIKAKALFIRDVDYIVRDDQVIIVDPGTGRVQMNRRWNDNLHQAVEAKEQVEIHSENAIIASVSYQCFFKLYKKLSGMTGTATTEAEEFEIIYNMRVVVVPKHRPNARVDAPTAMFRDAMTRWNAVANVVVSCHYEGRPVLVGTTSVEDSETLSMVLDEYLWRAPDDTVVKGVAHNLLNARPQYAAREAETIAQAGRLGAVTIATNMAGRGTDILLGGNAEGLARRAMKEHLFEALGLGDVLEEERETAFQSVSESLATVDLSETPAQIALEQARLIAKAACESAGPMNLENANEMLVRSVEKAGEKIRREERKKQRLLLTGWEAQGINTDDDDDDDDEDDKNKKNKVPFEIAIDFAAEQTLRETARLCKLESQEVIRRGGLQVVGTALHESRRIDRQLRGRAGRQGDPGSTVFCLSLDDEMIRTYSPAMSKQSSAWDFAGLAPEEPMYGTLVDVQLESIQKNIEDYLSAGRQSTFDADRVLDSQRNAVYELRRMVLVGGQQTLRERLFRYVDAVVDNYCVAANVSGSTPVKNWNIELLMDLLREVFAGRKDRFRMTNNEPVSPHPHYLPGVSAADLKDALLRLEDKKGSRTLPEPRRMPPLDANPVAVRASISGVNLAYADGSGLAGGLMKTDSSGSVADTEPEAEKDAIAERLKKRLEPPKAESSSKEVVKAFTSGRHAKKARQLRAYLSEAAIQQYLDRFARLARLDYIREELEDVERLWVLRAIDERYKQHLVHMSSLKDSVQVRAFGHLDPKEEFKIDGAKAFVDCVSDMRTDALRNVFFFVGASIEPTTEYETVPASNNDDDNGDSNSDYDPDEDLMRELTEEEREKVRSFLARAKENGISVTESEDGFGDWTGSSGEDDDADADEDEDSI